MTGFTKLNDAGIMLLLLIFNLWTNGNPIIIEAIILVEIFKHEIGLSDKWGWTAWLSCYVTLILLCVPVWNSRAVCCPVHVSLIDYFCERVYSRNLNILSIFLEKILPKSGEDKDAWTRGSILDIKFLISRDVSCSINDFFPLNTNNSTNLT